MTAELVLSGVYLLFNHYMTYTLRESWAWNEQSVEHNLITSLLSLQTNDYLQLVKCRCDLLRLNLL